MKKKPITKSAKPIRQRGTKNIQAVLASITPVLPLVHQPSVPEVKMPVPVSTPMVIRDSYDGYPPSWCANHLLERMTASTLGGVNRIARELIEVDAGDLYLYAKGVSLSGLHSAFQHYLRTVWLNNAKITFSLCVEGEVDADAVREALILCARVVEYDEFSTVTPRRASFEELLAAVEEADLEGDWSICVEFELPSSTSQAEVA